jgi:hypothetical protein
MEPVDDERTELSVNLEWPEDPLADAPVELAPEPAEPGDPIEARLAALERVMEGTAPGGGHATVDDVMERLDRVAVEIVQALRAINDTLQRALKQSDASVDKRLRALGVDIAQMTEAARSQREIYGEDLAAELKAWRRRLPAKPSAKKPRFEESELDDLVTRLADEIEIRLAAIRPANKKR